MYVRTLCKAKGLNTKMSALCVYNLLCTAPFQFHIQMMHDITGHQKKGVLSFYCCLLSTAHSQFHIQVMHDIIAGLRRKGVLSFYSVCLFSCFLAFLFFQAISEPSFELGS